MIRDASLRSWLQVKWEREILLHSPALGQMASRSNGMRRIRACSVGKIVPSAIGCHSTRNSFFSSTVLVTFNDTILPAEFVKISLRWRLRLHTQLSSNVKCFLCKTYRSDFCRSIKSKILKIGQELSQYSFIYLQRNPQKVSNVKYILYQSHGSRFHASTKSKIMKIGIEIG